jgi:hypothetical protein
MSLTLHLQPGTYAVCRLPHDSPMPDIPRAELLSVTWTEEELSIICLEEDVPEGAMAYHGYRCLKLQGPFPAESVGILSSILRPLADAGVPIMAFSTFDTDHILVPEVHLDTSVRALRESGFVVVSSCNERN